MDPLLLQALLVLAGAAGMYFVHKFNIPIPGLPAPQPTDPTNLAQLIASIIKQELAIFLPSVKEVVQSRGPAVVDPNAPKVEKLADGSYKVTPAK